MKKVIKYIVLALSFAWMVLVIALLPSCTPQKRLDRLLRNHPELLNRVDTVHITDTVTVPKISLDTVFSSNFDTIKIVRDCVRVRLVKHHDTIKLTITKPADTIVRNINVPVKRCKESKSKISSGEIILLCLLFAALAMLIIGVFKLPHKTEKEYYDNN